MHELVILTRHEEDQLVRAIEAGVDVQRLRQMFLWCQGPLRALLPHGVMVCLHLGDDDRIAHIECLNSVRLDAEALSALIDPTNGLVLRLMRHCRDAGRLACRIDHEQPSTVTRIAEPLRADLARWRLGHALVQGTEPLPGGATFFALFDFAAAPTARQEFFLTLLLPYLHMAFLRVLANREPGISLPAGGAVELTAREIEVLSWVFKGKSNPEIGLILGLSALTVKNHLRKIFRKLGVGSRVQALARCHDLHLLRPADEQPAIARPPRSLAGA